MQQASLFPAETRRCRGCREVKPVDEFNRRSVTSDKRHSTCKACTRVERRQHYLAAGGVEVVRRKNWARYGLTPEAYWAMVATQDGRCAICGEPPPGDGLLQVDHCHETGVTRALLCSGCNRALGLIRDRVDVLRACIAYLDRHGAAGLTASTPLTEDDEPEEQRS